MCYPILWCEFMRERKSVKFEQLSAPSSMSSGAPSWLFPNRAHVRRLVSSIWQHARMQVFTFFIKSARDGFPSFHVSPNRKSTSEISLGVQTFLAFLNSNERAMAFASFSLKATLNSFI